MPTKEKIKYYWGEYLVNVGKFDSVEELNGGDFCFACGFDGEIQRAHIVPKCLGGSDTVDNLHLLCRNCHKASEYLHGPIYFKWFYRRNFVDRMIQAGINHGIIISGLVTNNIDLQYTNELVTYLNTTDRK